MKILAFDTCFNKSYIALTNDDSVIAERIIESDDKNYHSAYLIPEIRNILKSSKLFIKDIDAIAVNVGPGSFTGIRAGITIARVLAQQFDLKLTGVNSMKILSKLSKDGKNTVITLDARKNKVYFAYYSGDKELIPPCLIEKDELISKIKSDDVIIADRSIYGYLKENSVNSLCYDDFSDNFALFLSDIAGKMLKTNNNFNWAEVKPLYIQKPSITLPKAVKNG
jgi:tRNA threonylcarbamoyl adenosine modification protein YeaZ